MVCICILCTLLDLFSFVYHKSNQVSSQMNSGSGQDRQTSVQDAGQNSASYGCLFVIMVGFVFPIVVALWRWALS